MVNLQDSAEAIALAIPTLEPEMALEIPVGAHHAVQALMTAQGLVLAAIDRTDDATPEAAAARRDGVVRLAALSRRSRTVVGSLDGQGGTVLSTVIDAQAPSQEILQVLSELFQWLNDPDAEPDGPASLPPGAFA